MQKLLKALKAAGAIADAAEVTAFLAQKEWDLNSMTPAQMQELVGYFSDRTAANAGNALAKTEGDTDLMNAGENPELNQAIHGAQQSVSPAEVQQQAMLAEFQQFVAWKAQQGANDMTQTAVSLTPLTLSMFSEQMQGATEAGVFDPSRFRGVFGPSGAEAGVSGGAS